MTETAVRKVQHATFTTGVKDGSLERRADQRVTSLCLTEKTCQKDARPSLQQKFWRRLTFSLALLMLTVSVTDFWGLCSVKLEAVICLGGVFSDTAEHWSSSLAPRWN